MLKDSVKKMCMRGGMEALKFKLMSSLEYSDIIRFVFLFRTICSL